MNPSIFLCSLVLIMRSKECTNHTSLSTPFIIFKRGNVHTQTFKIIKLVQTLFKYGGLKYLQQKLYFRTLRPCQGKLPLRKYISMQPNASRSSRLLCSVRGGYYAILNYNICYICNYARNLFLVYTVCKNLMWV